MYAGEATRLAYGTEEAKEGRTLSAKRPRDFSRFPNSLEHEACIFSSRRPSR